ncbi:hypothetical protein MJO47_09275 [Desulfuromonas sp. KJ2020]|uniref:hypothetical protein n=1 Tax=Desulfuromonas sp. KJ2020 TaxID=2919173 RepID=UPI0020A7D7EE|nr:hypothetical protein [Desulfuromonas sp. KJ2020]MCP3177288.1 hypothetical protein [Desulfuromonas sp. KJ2020]
MDYHREALERAQNRELRSNSELSGGLAAEVSKAEKARRLAGEIIATLYVNVERGNLPEALLERLDIWKNRLREYGG